MFFIGYHFPSFSTNFSILFFQIIDNTMEKKNYLITVPLVRKRKHYW
ncbi:hypothetical protein BSCG_02818 [Bacteroides sp. 2_2_4]|nr:hypothetical protein BSCG_02818 [Bacteroides sp. 2_2_4]